MAEPKFLTIRQTAKTGILTEHQLRLMEKQKRLPCIYVGENQTRCMINYPALLQQLDRESRGTGAASFGSAAAVAAV